MEENQQNKHDNAKGLMIIVVFVVVAVAVYFILQGVSPKNKNGDDQQNVSTGEEYTSSTENSNQSETTQSSGTTSTGNSNQSEPTQSSGNTSTSVPTQSSGATSTIEEYHLPAIVDTLFSQTAEDYFNGVRPLADNTIMGSATKVVSDGDYSFEVFYDPYVDQNDGQAYATGYPLLVFTNPPILFPELDGYNYYSLQSVFGNNISYEYLETEYAEGEYYITAYVDGYELVFGYIDGGVDSLDEEINNCFIYKE